MTGTAVPIPFDPWTATMNEAMRAAESDPKALAKREAAQEVLRAEDDCLSPDGGCEVMRAMSLCLVNELMPPRWLSDEFNALYARVREAEVGSWDEAIGQPFPPRTRLHDVRENRRLRRVVHAAVFEAVVDDGAAIDRDLFDRIGRRPDVCRSGSTCEKRYYEAITEGMVNPIGVRAAIARSARSAPVSHALRSWAGIDQTACDSDVSAN